MSINKRGNVLSEKPAAHQA